MYYTDNSDKRKPLLYNYTNKKEESINQMLSSPVLLRRYQLTIKIATLYQRP